MRLGNRTEIVRSGTTLHVPSNIPHSVRVIDGQPVRMLMLCTPAMKEFNEKHDNFIFTIEFI